MAVSDDAHEIKSSDANNNLPIFNADNLQNNMKIIYYSRTFLSIICGVVAGILGLTGLKGFIFYFLIMGITSLGLAAKAKFSLLSYFDSWNRIVLDGVLGGLMFCIRHCAHILKLKPWTHGRRADDSIFRWMLLPNANYC